MYFIEFQQFSLTKIGRIRNVHEGQLTLSSLKVKWFGNVQVVEILGKSYKEKEKRENKQDSVCSERRTVDGWSDRRMLRWRQMTSCGDP